MPTRRLAYSLSLVVVLTILLAASGVLTNVLPGRAVAMPQGAPGGFYVIGSVPLDRSRYPIVGDMQYWHWAHFHKGPGQFDWTLIEEYLARNGADGRPIGFAFTPYEGRDGGGVIAMPEWAMQDGTSATDPQATIVRLPDGHVVPKYWSPTYLQRYGDFVRALGERYRNDPRIAWIGIGTGIYGETQPVAGQDDLALRDAGLTSAIWVNTTNAITDMYLQAFSETGRLAKPLLLQNGPFFLDPYERRDFSVYAAERGIGLSVNSLFADGNALVRADDAACPGCGGMDQLMAYWPQVPIAFEIYKTTLPNPTEFDLGMLNALDKHADYLRIRRQFLVEDNGWENPEYIELMRWAAPYIGVGAATAPSAWVAMREHRNPMKYGVFGTETISWYPQWGNYTFFLTQDDTLPGGRTVPETNDASVLDLKENTAPYNAGLPRSKECWVCRRTDAATGNPYVFFKVAPAFLGDNRSDFRIRVTYLDRGNDLWRLLYDSRSGAKQATLEGSAAVWVQKTNSNQWKVATFRVSDAAFSVDPTDRSDFYLDSVSDGDEWLHFIEVIHAGTSAATPTPTWPLSTATPTPQPTATRNAVDTATPQPTPAASVTAATTTPVTAVPTASVPPQMTVTPVPNGTPTATPLPKPVIEIVQPGVHAYSGPGYQYEYVGTVNVGDRYDLIGRNAAATWARVCCVRGSLAWVEFSAGTSNVNVEEIRVVTTPEPPATPNTPLPPGAQTTPTRPARITFTITQAQATGYRGPGEAYETVGTVQTGAAVDVTGRDASAQWLKVCCIAGSLAWLPVSSGTLNVPVDTVRVIATPAAP